MYIPQTAIEKYLLEQEINPANNGFTLLTHLLIEVFETDCNNNWSMTACYIDVGTKNRIKPATVERAIRYALKKSGINCTIKEFCTRTYYHFKHRT